MKLQKKIEAIKLRQLGKSYKEILSVVKVAKGTLSKWLRDIPMTDAQKLALRGRLKSGYLGAKANQEKARKRNNEIFVLAKAEANFLIRNPLFLSGLMLYWAEGTKDGNTVAFTNSDPKLIALMMRWFREICKILDKKFRILIFIHQLQVNDNWKQKWVEITRVPESQFIRPFIKPTITIHRRNKLYNGTCAIRIHSSDLAARIKGWQAAVLELFGIPDG